MSLKSIFPLSKKTATNKNRKSRRRFRQIESLEGREMMAGDTFVVGNTDDSGPGSLRWAIEQANDNDSPIPDIIEFHWSIEGTIHLTGEELRITDSMEIHGPGPDQLTIDGWGNSRVFNIDDGLPESDEMSAVIRGVTITGGSTLGPDGGNGGGIRSTESFKLIDVIVEENYTGAGGGNGGGIAMVGGGGTGFAINTIIRNNSSQAGSGGGIYLDSSDISPARFFVDHSQVTDNRTDAFHGGGIAVGYGNLWVRDSLVANNRTQNDFTFGGGLFAASSYSTQVVIEDSVVEGNHASFLGGGIFLHGNVEGSISSSEIRDNEAEFGGALATDVDHSFFIEDSSIDSNVAGFRGGGIHSLSELQIHRSTISNNSAGVDGGGIYLSTSLNDDTQIVNSTVSGNSALAGGGFDNGRGTATVISSTITNNEGGGVRGTCRITSKNSGCNSPSLTSFESTIVSGNQGPDISFVGGGWTPTVPFVSAGHNLIGDGNGQQAFSESFPHNDIFAEDPQLEPLADNGGPTMTHALVGGPALNNGSNLTGIGSDQRGDAFSRSRLGGVDIGAFELQSAPPVAAVAVVLSEDDDWTTDASAELLVAELAASTSNPSTGVTSIGLYGPANTDATSNKGKYTTGDFDSDGPAKSIRGSGEGEFVPQPIETFENALIYVD